MTDPLRPATEAEELSYRIRAADLTLAFLTDNADAQNAQDYRWLCECGQWAGDDDNDQCETCLSARFTCEVCGRMFDIESLGDRFSKELICSTCDVGVCENKRRLLDELLDSWSAKKGSGDRLADLLDYARSLTPAQ